MAIKQWTLIEFRACDLCDRRAIWKHPAGGLRCSICPRPEEKFPRLNESQRKALIVVGDRKPTHSLPGPTLQKLARDQLIEHTSLGWRLTYKGFMQYEAIKAT